MESTKEFKEEFQLSERVSGKTVDDSSNVSDNRPQELDTALASDFGETLSGPDQKNIEVLSDKIKPTMKSIRNQEVSENVATTTNSRKSYKNKFKKKMRKGFALLFGKDRFNNPGDIKKVQQARADSFAGMSEDAKLGAFLADRLSHALDEFDVDYTMTQYKTDKLSKINEACVTDMLNFQPAQDDLRSVDVSPIHDVNLAYSSPVIEEESSDRETVMDVLFDKNTLKKSASDGQLQEDKHIEHQNIWHQKIVVGSAEVLSDIDRNATYALHRLEQGSKLKALEDLVGISNPQYLYSISNMADDQPQENDNNLLQKKPIPEGENPDDYLYGLAAFNHYCKYQTLEHEIIEKQLEEKRTFLKIHLYEKKHGIEKALMEAKDYYCNKERILKPNLNRRLTIVATANNEANYLPSAINPDIRVQLDTLPLFFPWFIYLSSVLQTFAVIGQLVWGGVTTISFLPSFETLAVDGMTGESLARTALPYNVWIGPSEQSLIRMGAVFAPCIRVDELIGLRVAQFKNLLKSPLGCCEIAGAGAGTTTEDECKTIVTNGHIISYLWRNMTCGSRALQLIGGVYEAHRFKPCCYGTVGHCMLTTHSHCKFLGGMWFSNANEHCGQVKCESKICATWEKSMPDIILSDASQEKNHRFLYFGQIWRFLISLFFHHGIIHVVLVVLVQLYMGVDAEKLSGWFRIGSIYIVSGLGGLLIGSLFKPYEANLGAHGAASGLIGMNFIELLQAWKLIKKPCLALLRLCSLTIAMLAAGFFPQVHQMTQIGGFVLGMLMSLLCLPYITFEKFHSKSRPLLMTVSSIILIGLISITSFMFFYTQPAGISASNKASCIVQGQCDLNVSLFHLL